MDHEQMLSEYSAQLGLAHPMSLESLIQSHRFLRGEFQKSHGDRMAELDLAREAGRRAGQEEVKHGQYIAVDRLRSMSVQELMEFLHE